MAARIEDYALIGNCQTVGFLPAKDPRMLGTVEAIRKQLVAKDYEIREIIFGIVESRAFQYRGTAK